MVGFVTDHVMLLQCYSKLYHYLTVYETDPKRILAMETRRIDMLEPIIYTIHKTVYETLHKEISYELGETYLSLLDVKLEKFRNRIAQNDHRAQMNRMLEWDIDIRQLKSAEIEKCNSYCKGALAMFSHFTRLYTSDKGNLLDYQKK